MCKPVVCFFDLRAWSVQGCQREGWAPDGGVWGGANPLSLSHQIETHHWKKLTESDDVVLMVSISVMCWSHILM